MGCIYGENTFKAKQILRKIPSELESAEMPNHRGKGFHHEILCPKSAQNHPFILLFTPSRVC
jgi:hypothetical protein